MDIATLLQDGENQVVLLPEGYRLPGKQAYVKKLGNALVLIPEPNQDPWQPLKESLSLFSDDYMAERGQPLDAE